MPVADRASVLFLIQHHLDECGPCFQAFDFETELKALIAEMPNPVALDLQEVELVDLDAVRFLAAVERGGLELRNLPPYVRAWVLLERERLGDSE